MRGPSFDLEPGMVRAPVACPGCGMDDEPLREMPGVWCIHRWLCRWCADLVELQHNLGA